MLRPVEYIVLNKLERKIEYDNYYKMHHTIKYYSDKLYCRKVYICERIKEMNKYYVCSRSRMMEWLMNRGWIWEKTVPDCFRKDLVNWAFERSPEFDEDVRYYFEHIVNNGKGVDYRPI